MECSEVDSTEVVWTVQQQQSTAATHCNLFQKTKEKNRRGERREIAIILILPFSHSVFLPFLLFLQPLEVISFLPPENGRGNGCLEEEINCTEKCCETTRS